MAKVEIYTDGSCCNATHNSGGYGVVVLNGTERHFCGGSYFNTTSARMEILAIIRGLGKCEPGDDIVIYSDNQYCVNAWEKKWVWNWQNSHFRGKKNADLWKLFLNEASRLRSNITLKWIRGHNGNKYNEIADHLANMGANRTKKIKDIRYT